jgi:hypothetical protein
MDRSATAWLSAALAAVLLAACAPDAPTRTLGPDDALPEPWLVGPGTDLREGTAVVWVFRPEDCLSCPDVDYPLRRLQARHGAAVPFVAVHVGGRHRDTLAASFFRQRRVAVRRALTVDPRDFRREFGEPPLPALYVVRDGKVRWASAGQGTGSYRTVRLDTLIHGLLAGDGGGDGTEKAAVGAIIPPDS